MSTRVPGTEHRGGFPLSSFTYTPLQHVRNLYVRFVQGLFYGAPKGNYHWDPDPELSEIVIQDESPIHVDTVGMRPCITFTRGTVQFYSLGLDDMMSYSFETGQKKKSVLVPGTMSINCCSRVDIECENIAWVVAEHIWLLREVLIRQGFFEVGRQPVIGAPSKAGSIVAGDSADEWFATVVACPFQFYRTSQFYPLNQQVVKNIELSLQAAMHDVKTGQYVDPFNHEVPYGMVGCPPPPFVPGASDVYGQTPNPGLDSRPESPIVPHPLNPAVKVVLRSSNPFGPAVKPPSIGGRVLPIRSSCVEESPTVTAASKHRV